jgi:hypothetical protein
MRPAARAAGVAAAAADRDEVDVLGLDDEATLATIAQMRARVADAQVVEVRAVAHWADRHRVTDPEEWLARGAVSAEGREMAYDLLEGAGSSAGELGVEGVLRLGGEGAFAVREFAVTELAALLQMSEQGARDYVGQVVELRDRLPRLWGQVMSGRLPVWKARRIAEQTIGLGDAAAGFVDAQLAEFAHRLSVSRIMRCVDAAITRFHPDLARKRAEAAEESRGVWLHDDTTDGTTRVAPCAPTFSDAPRETDRPRPPAASTRCASKHRAGPGRHGGGAVRRGPGDPWASRPGRTHHERVGSTH